MHIYIHICCVFFVMPPRVKKTATAAVVVEPVIAVAEPAAVDEPAVAAEPAVVVTNTKKRSRKPKASCELPLPSVEPSSDAPPSTSVEPEEPSSAEDTTAPKKASKPKKTAATEPNAPTKKRGRKPKGGKLIQNLSQSNASVSVVPNIILHLKCGAADIEPSALTASNDNFKPGDVVSFNVMDPKGSDLHDSYHSEMLTSKASVTNNAYNYLNDTCSDDECDDNGDSSTKNIMKKLNHLKTSFHMSDLFQAIGAAPRRSCCFWDTCEFDTPPVYLPKCISNNGGYVVYACFCSPECALAYLMNERLDTSVKFERCQMLNAMHGKINVSIKPAPNPQYMLSKFYGNLTIQEYRKLFKSEQIVYVVNKPLTHVLPEIYEENNDFMLNNKIIPTNNYKLKKKTSSLTSVTAFG